MKKTALAALALAVSIPALATPITGKVAIAGASVFTPSGIRFTNPAVTLIATGNFLPLLTQTEVLTSFSFNSAVGKALFHDALPDIAMDIVSLKVITDNGMFLNVAGTADFVEPGFSTTLYDFTLTATRPDDVSSFTLSAAPAMVPEPGSLLLVGTSLMLAAMPWWWKSRKRTWRDATRL